MYNENKQNDIEEILGNISADEDAGASVIETEFVFGEEEHTDEKVGLVFDDSEEDEPAPEQDPVANINFETVEAEEEKQIEFSLPEKFEVNKKYDTKPSTEEAPRIITTYVPTFTGIGDSYRMKDDPRPRIETKKAVSNGATEEYAEDVDPTAEIDESVEIKASVPLKNGGIDERDNESVSKVFKFAENEESFEDAEGEDVTVSAETVEEDTEEYEEFEEHIASVNGEIPDPELSSDSTEVAERTVSTHLAGRLALIDPPADVGNKMTQYKRGGEYASYAQRDTYKDNYLDRIMSVRVRFFACAAVALLLLAMELLFAAGVNIPELLNLVTVPGAMALLDIQFVVCLFLISLPETVKAISLLLKKQVTPALYLPISFIALIAYTVVAVAITPAAYPLFGVLFAVAVLVSIGSTYYKISADFTAFKLVSANGEKKIIDIKYTRNLERENSALDGAVEEHKSKLVRVFRTLFVDDFFKRAERCAENSQNNLIMLGSSFGLAVVFGVVAYFIPGGIMSAFAAFVMVLMTAFPVISIVAQNQPYYHAALEANSESSAVVGESSLLEYSETDVVTFEDTEVFGVDDVTLQRIMLYGQSENLSKALRQMSALFIKVGGPLDLLFSNSLDRKCPPADNVQIFENGILGEIDGVSCAGGNLKFMSEHGMIIPDDEGRFETVSNSTRIMYAAENGKVYAKFYIRYSFSEDFSMLLPALEDEKIKVLVYTRDPGINEDLMKTLTAGTDKIRVIRRNTPHSEDSPLYNKVSSGAVTVGDKSNVINTIFIAKKYAALESRITVSEHISMAVGGALAAILAVGGMFIVPPIALGIWQAAWCAALHIISRRSFTEKNKKG